MDALLPALLAIALAEQGDRMQLLARASSARFGRPGTVAAGLIVAGAANSAIGGIGGGIVHGLVPYRALTLLLAVALLSAGAAALIRAKPSAVIAYAQLGAFGGPAFAGFVLGFGGGAQFLTFAIAARSGSALLAAAGATLGLAIAIVPAVLAGDRLAHVLRPVRIGAGVLFLIVGATTALAALRLI